MEPERLALSEKWIILDELPLFFRFADQAAGNGRNADHSRAWIRHFRALPGPDCRAAGAAISDVCA